MVAHFGSIKLSLPYVVSGLQFEMKPVVVTPNLAKGFVWSWCDLPGADRSGAALGAS